MWKWLLQKSSATEAWRTEPFNPPYRRHWEPLVLAVLFGVAAVLIFMVAIVVPRRVVAHESSRHHNLRDAALAWRNTFLVDPALASGLHIWEAASDGEAKAFLVVRPLGEDAAWWESWVSMPGADQGPPVREEPAYHWVPALRRTMGQRTNLPERDAILGRGTLVVNLGGGSPGEEGESGEHRDPVVVVGTESLPSGDRTDAELGPAPACVPLLARDLKRTSSGRLAVQPAPNDTEEETLFWLNLAGNNASVWRSTECPAEAAALVGRLQLGQTDSEIHALLTFNQAQGDSPEAAAPEVLVGEQGGYSLWRIAIGSQEYVKAGGIGPSGLNSSGTADAPLLRAREVLDSLALPKPAQTAVRARLKGKLSHLVRGKTEGTWVFADCATPQWSQYAVLEVNPTMRANSCQSAPEVGALIDRSQCLNATRDFTWTRPKPTCSWPASGRHNCFFTVEKAPCKKAP